MYYFTYDPWVGKQLYLEDFYVMEPYRGGCSLPVTSSSPAGVSLLVSGVLAGMGIGSEVLRHLSNVSERQGSREMIRSHMTVFRNLYLREFQPPVCSSSWL